MGPGNIGWRPPLLASDDPATRKTKLSAELANGRLAMMAIIGMFFQDGLTGSAWGDWATYTGSPLRAFESELGVQACSGSGTPWACAKTVIQTLSIVGASQRSSMGGSQCGPALDI